MLFERLLNAYLLRSHLRHAIHRLLSALSSPCSLIFGVSALRYELPSGNRAASGASVLWQHALELPPHPFKVAPQLDDDGTVPEVRTVHVVGYEGHPKFSPRGVLGANEEPETKCANCERRHPSGNGMAAQSTEKPSGDRSHQPDAADQKRVVSHSALGLSTLAIRLSGGRMIEGAALTSV